MAQIVNIASNLPSASSPWGRQVTDGLNTIATDVERFKANQTNLNRANNTNIQTLVTQQATLTSQQAALTSQQAALTSQQNYLAGLVTVGDSGAAYNSGNIPGDQTTRWTPSGNKVTLRVPTGKVNLRFGVGQLTMQAGNSSILGYLRVHISTPSGSYDGTQGSGTRFFLTSGTYMGIPMSSERTVDGLPTNENITFELEFGTWSAGTNPLGNMQFTAGFVTVQVVPA